KRVLRPSGVLLISSPDKRVYSELPNYTNPYHVKELSRSEFFELLQRYFSNITGYGQRVIHGSAILADDIQTATASFREQDDTTQGSAGLIDSMYLIALASDGPLTPIPSGVFEGPIEENESYAALNQALAAANVAYATADKARAAAEEAQVAVKEQLAAQRAISAGLSARLHALESEQAARETELAELRVSAEARQRALDAVTKAELDSNATIADMRRENTSLTERIRRDNEQIQQLRATIDALHRSWSWRLTSPVRLVTTLLRRMRPTAIRPFRSIASGQFGTALSPLKDLRALGANTYISTGADPQFSIAPGWHPFRQGLALITIEVEDTRRPLRPILYAFHGRNGEAVTGFRLPVVTGGTVNKLISLPAGVGNMRLDPTDVPGVLFSIKRVHLRNVGRLGLLRQAMLEFDPAQRRQAAAAALRGKFGIVKQMVLALFEGSQHADYAGWVELYDTLMPADHAAIRACVANLEWKPR